MDTGNGVFEQVAGQFDAKEIGEKMREKEREHPNHGGWFHVGQIITIDGSVFRVKSVKPNELRLKLLPKNRAG